MIAKVGVVAEFFPIEGAEVFRSCLFNSSLSTSTANRTRLTWRCAVLWTRYFPCSCNY